MRIDLNNPDEFTLANVRQFIASGDPTREAQLRVSLRGWVDFAKADEEQGVDNIAFELAPWSPEDRRVGPEAAADDQWVLRVFEVLRDNWPDPRSRLIDIGRK